MREGERSSFLEMPIAYDPTDFWRVLFSRTGSALPAALPRALIMLPLAALAQVGYHYEFITQDATPVLLPISLLVGLLTSFRITDAYGKWNRASGHVLHMHKVIRETMSKLLAYIVVPPDHRQRELRPRLEEIRRLLVLAAVLIKKHVRGEYSLEYDFKDELKRSLVTEMEVQRCAASLGVRLAAAHQPIALRAALRRSCTR